MGRWCLLLVFCLGLCGCQGKPIAEPADKPDESEQVEEAAESDREPLTQRVRRMSPRRYFK